MVAVFYRLVDQLREVLPGFYKHLATDSKAISFFAKSKNRNEAPDGRRDKDADSDYGIKYIVA